MPLLLHGVERSESQPDYTPLFSNRLHDPPNDDWVWLRCLQEGVAGGSILPWRFLQLYTLALGKEHYLCVDVRLSPRDLRLGQRRIVGLFIKGGDIGAFPLPGVEHDWEWAISDFNEY